MFDISRDILGKYNPFGFTTEDAKTQIFDTAETAYLMAMVAIWRKFPRGYIELPYLLMGFYKHLTYNECCHLAKMLKPMGLEGIILVNGYDTKDGKKKLEQILRGFSYIAEIPFNNYVFEEAHKLLLYRIEVENKKKKENEN